MTPRCVLLFAFFSLMVVLLVTSSLWAQLATATLNGFVTGPEDLAVAGAKVTLTNQATGVKRETTTGDAGQYVFVELTAGDYTLRVESTSFATAEVKGIRLEVGTASTMDVRLSLAKVGEVVTVTGGLPALARSAATLERPVLNSHLVTVLPGFSFKILAEPKRPFEKLSTETLLAQFSQLCDAYREDERKAEDGSRAHSHYIETLVRLRGTVGELVRRHAFGFAEARDYIEFLYRNHLVGNEDVRLIGEISYDPVAVLRLQQDLQSSLKKLSDPSHVLVTHSGVALGFLEAHPAEEKLHLAVPGNITLSRHFEPITKNIADPNVVYKIRLWIDWPTLQHGMSKRVVTPDVQTIASSGQLALAQWIFEVNTTEPFGQFELAIRAELQKYSAAGSMADSQPIRVPIRVVTIVPSPTWSDKAWKTFGRWFGSPATLVGVLIGVLGMIGVQENVRRFFASQAKKWYSGTRDKLNAIIFALRRRQRH